MVALAIGHALTGFRHDRQPRPHGFQIVDVQPPRELILTTGESIQEPSVALLQDTIEAYLRSHGSSLLLVVDEGDSAKRLFADYIDGEIRIQALGPYGCRAPRPRGRRPLDALDVKRCFGDFFDEGALSDRYLWEISADI